MGILSGDMIVETLEHAFMITGFVAAMMLVIEYLNVLTRGNWQARLRAHRWGQCILGALLGVAPGCLGAFAVISLYTHRILSAGALVATMIATSGDEAFVMLAMFPEKALLLFAVLFFIGLVSGLVVDVFPGKLRIGGGESEACLRIHAEEAACRLPAGRILSQWRRCSAHRGVLSLFLGLFMFSVASGNLGPETWDWVRITLLLTAGMGLFVVATVSDHFLEEHLWNHIVKKHVWRVFLWTLGALILVHVFVDHLDLKVWIKGSRLTVLMLACLIGLIPEAGPHLIFVTLYAQGVLPFSVLLAGSIVQDGHGMLPLLAHSRGEFIRVKAINFAIGLAVGLIGLLTGW